MSSRADAHDEALVFVIDLRDAAMQEIAREVDAAIEGAFVPRVLPAPPEAPIAAVALLVGAGEGEPFVLPIEPTTDVRWLDALARLVRFAVLRGATVEEVATQYGEEYERALVGGGRLPGWALGALDAPTAARLPETVRRALRARAS